MKIFNEKLHSEFLFYKKVDGECAIHLLLLIPRKLTLSPCLSENNFILLSLFMNIFVGCRIPSCIVLYFLSKYCKAIFYYLKAFKVTDERFDFKLTLVTLYMTFLWIFYPRNCAGSCVTVLYLHHYFSSWCVLLI